MGGFGHIEKGGKKDTQSAPSSNREVTNNEQEISTHYSKPESDLEPGTQICYTCRISDSAFFGKANVCITKQ